LDGPDALSGRPVFLFSDVTIQAFHSISNMMAFATGVKRHASNVMSGCESYRDI